jgi:rRNA pseudouridine-1189 N-methylase Emg1 (Nep1/Mra1 family)
MESCVPTKVQFYEKLFIKKKEVIDMKFRDIFLPKIARSDPQVRKAAIREEVNVELLKQLVQKETDPEVIDVAEKRIRELRPDAVHEKESA